MTELEKDCLFCKIIRGEIPSYTVFENDDVKAFLDISVARTSAFGAQGFVSVLIHCCISTS